MRIGGKGQKGVSVTGVLACLDFGLERIQFSVFRGKLNRNKREELLDRLTAELGDEPGKILIQPVCEEDCESSLELATKWS